jgi:hypothetical protein
MLFCRRIFSGLKEIFEGFLAFLLELVLRIKSAINPSAWPSARRIQNIHKGDLCSASGEIAIFASSYTEKYPEFFLNLFKALRNAGIDVVIVSNRNLSDENIKFLKKYCRWFIIRKNIGRDFGAYADSIKFLDSEQVPIDRLFLFNDSLYYRDCRSLKGLIEGLRSGDFTCATVALSPIPHAQSFCISFGKKVLSHASFRRYWSTYIQVSTRRWAIKKGELGLSISLKKANFMPQAVYSSFELGHALNSAQKSGLRDFFMSLPNFSSIQAVLFNHLSTLVPDQAVGSAAKLGATLTLLSKHIIYLIERSRLDAAPVSSDNESSRYNGSEIEALYLSEELSRQLLLHSPIHSCGFLWWRYTEFPLMKRDVLFRGVFSTLQIEHLLRNEAAPLAESIRADLRRRFEGRFLRGWDGFLFRKGFI